LNLSEEEHRALSRGRGDQQGRAIAAGVDGQLGSSKLRAPLLEPIGNIPLSEAKEQYYAMLDDTCHGCIT
jgi:hypothetical protein